MKRLLSKLLYACGAYGAYHRRRNRRVLTVIALHRVLASTDARWRTCDPLYTLSDRLFEQCLDFLARHYSIVTLADVAGARYSPERLPDCPLLITFDDGWADSYDYALPALQRRKLPGVLFVAADALDRQEGFFQERMIAAWRRRRLSDAALLALWRQIPAAIAPANLQSEDSIRSLIAALQRLPPERRTELLGMISSELADGCRQMLTTKELRAIAACGIDVGTHGKRHEALTDVADVDTELREPKQIVAAALSRSADTVDSLSFPFSKQNAAVIESARDAGYRLLFGGGASLTPMHGGLPDLIARVGISAPHVDDGRGNLSAHALAAYLFRRPHRGLVATP